MLRPLTLDLLGRRSDVAVLFLGDGSAEFLDDLVAQEPWIRERVHATGRLCAVDLSCHLSACDLMVQRYPDGISARRTSAMAPLSHGIPIVSSIGIHSEPIWAQTGAVALASTDDVESLATQVERLLGDDTERRRVGSAGLTLYARRFDLKHSIDALREGASQDNALEVRQSKPI